MFMLIKQDFKLLQVGDYSFIIHKSAYHLFSVHLHVIYFKTRFFFSANEEIFSEILSGNHRFLILVIRFVTPHSCACLSH